MSSGPISNLPQNQSNFPSASPPIRKEPSRIQVILDSVFGPNHRISQAWKIKNIVTEMKRDGVYSLATDYLGVSGSSEKSQKKALTQMIQSIGVDTLNETLNDLRNTNVYVEKVLGGKGRDVREYTYAIIKNDQTICDELWGKLTVQAIRLGYSDKEKGFRSLNDLEELWKGSSADKILTLRLIADQMSSQDIQVAAMREVFTMVSENDLKLAVATHYEAYDALPVGQKNTNAKVRPPSKKEYEKLLSLRIPISSTQLARIFFKNEKGQYEVAIVHTKDTPASGKYKQYRFTGTMSAIKDIACLDLKLSDAGEAHNVKRELALWQEQMNAGVRHIPILYYVTEGSIFCENFAQDMIDYMNSKKDSDDREAMFLRAGLVIFEYLEDIAKLQLVHRDIKPENLLISKDEQKVVVTDFGFVARLGQKVAAAGTPSYIDPAHNVDFPAPFDVRTDLFSAASTLAMIRYRQDPKGTISEIKGRALGQSNPNLDEFDKLLDAMRSPDLARRPTLEYVITRWRELKIHAESQKI